MKTIMVDVDMTLVDTVSGWLRWFEIRSGVTIDPTRYHLEKLMEGHINEDPLNYWRQKDMYETLSPYDKSVSTIRRLVDAGFDLVFVTWSPYNGQIRAKDKWLAEHYGADIPVVHTDLKHYVDCDIMIDDNEWMIRDVLKRRAGTEILKMETTMNKDYHGEGTERVLTMRNWEDIQEYFHKREGVRFE